MKAAIFDFDGTIADSFDYVFNFLKREARNTQDYSEKELLVMRQMSMHKLALHLGIAPWRLVSVYLRGRRFMRRHMRSVQPFVGMDKVIEVLHSHGWKLYVASANSGRNVRLLLKREGLLDYFTAVQGGTGFMGKPRAIKYLLRRHKIEPSTTWYIGDETGDIVSAAAAGVRSLAVTWGFADPKNLEIVSPTAIAKRPTDIVEILEREWKK